MKHTPTSTVGRGRTVKTISAVETTTWHDDLINARLGDSLDFYAEWPAPTVIVS